jgi:prepilin-type N-terminal cleavage/methylation domain-containing protein
MKNHKNKANTRVSGYFMNKNSGFTLIEMLTVIFIIGLLASLLFPAFQQARNRGNINKATAEVIELTKAWGAYWIAYESWPSGGGVLTMSPDKVDILQGNNPDKIQFMTFPPTANSGQGFVDPWGKVYTVELKSPKSKKMAWAFETKVYLNNRNRQ